MPVFYPHTCGTLFGKERNEVVNIVQAIPHPENNITAFPATEIRWNVLLGNKNAFMDAFAIWRRSTGINLSLLDKELEFDSTNDDYLKEAIGKRLVRLQGQFWNVLRINITSGNGGCHHPNWRTLLTIKARPLYLIPTVLLSANYCTT